MKNRSYLALILFALFTACHTKKNSNAGLSSMIKDTTAVKPVVITDATLVDTDDPAIWIDFNQKDSSLIVGTDKDSANGGLYVFHLDGKLDKDRTVTGLKRPNNVDVAYGLMVNGKPTDIAVTTERGRNCIRVFSLPAMKAIDGGGIAVFNGEQQRQPMGIGLYTRPSDRAIFAVVSRKSGPEEGYLEEYLLTDNERGEVTGKLVRKFGAFSGKKEIEAVAVDNELGYIYYCDEHEGIRKYYADPAKGNKELALFGKGDFLEDNEGISIYKSTDSTGYLIVSDQSANRFNIYPRVGKGANQNDYEKICSIPMSTNNSDGNEVTSIPLPGFPDGLFVAMSDNRTFQLYRWQDLAKRIAQH